MHCVACWHQHQADQGNLVTDSVCMQRAALVCMLLPCVHVVFVKPIAHVWEVLGGLIGLLVQIIPPGKQSASRQQCPHCDSSHPRCSLWDWEQ